MSYESRRSAGPLLVIGLLLPCTAAAQDGGGEGEEFDPPFVPSNERVDEDLDSTLRKEYEGEPRKGEKDPPPRARAERTHPDRPPDPETPAPADDDDDDDDRIDIRLGGLAAHYYSTLSDVVVSHREGNLGGDAIEITKDDRIADFDYESSQVYRGWLDMGEHVSLEGGFTRTVYRDTRSSQASFTYGGTTFSRGDLVETEVDLRIADFDVVFKPVNNDAVELGLSFGGRYVFWRNEISRADVQGVEETETIEGLVPMIGFGLTLRPLPQVELFARGRVGHFQYSRDEYWRVEDDGEVEHVSAKHREQTAAEINAGLRILILDCIGVIGGYRLDMVDLEREVDQRAESVEGTSHGVYGGVVLEF